MNTPELITIEIPSKHIKAVVDLLRVNKVKHQPINKHGDAYEVTLQNGEMVSFLQLRYH